MLPMRYLPALGRDKGSFSDALLFQLQRIPRSMSSSKVKKKKKATMGQSQMKQIVKEGRD